jgi:hypothetical protein
LSDRENDTQDLNEPWIISFAAADRRFLRTSLTILFMQGCGQKAAQSSASRNEG